MLSNGRKHWYNVYLFLSLFIDNNNKDMIFFNIF